MQASPLIPLTTKALNKEIMDVLNPQLNTGALIRQPSGKDFVRGYNSPFDNMPDLEPTWTPLRSLDLRQSRPGFFDTFGCTNYGYLHTVEPQINRWIRKGTIDPEFYTFLKNNQYLQLNAAGEEIIVCSRAALGFMSNLQPNGNYLDLVANTARTKGLIPEALWDSDPSHFSSQAAWLRPVPQNLLDLAAQFQKFVDLAYDIDYGGQLYAPAHVKKAPLYVALCTCPGWGTDQPVKWCNVDQTNHAVSLHADTYPNPPVIQDSYPQFQKQLALDYRIPYIIQVFAFQKKRTTPMFGFKTATNQTVYVIQGSKFVPVTNWASFVELGGSTDTLITLSDAEMAKVPKAQVAKLDK